MVSTVKRPVCTGRIVGNDNCSTTTPTSTSTSTSTSGAEKTESEETSASGLPAPPPKHAGTASWNSLGRQTSKGAIVPPAPPSGNSISVVGEDGEGTSVVWPRGSEEENKEEEDAITGLSRLDELDWFRFYFYFVGDRLRLKDCSCSCWWWIIERVLEFWLVFYFYFLVWIVD